jgi:hypothetical protein
LPSKSSRGCSTPHCWQNLATQHSTVQHNTPDHITAQHMTARNLVGADLHLKVLLIKWCSSAPTDTHTGYDTLAVYGGRKFAGLWGWRGSARAQQHPKCAIPVVPAIHDDTVCLGVCHTHTVAPEVGGHVGTCQGHSTVGHLHTDSPRHGNTSAAATDEGGCCRRQQGKHTYADRGTVKTGARQVQESSLCRVTCG